MGKNKSVSCEVDASPKPTVYWKQRGKILKTCRRSLKCTLNIYLVNSTTTGNYTCVAVNTEGETTVNVKLTVIGNVFSFFYSYLSSIIISYL